MNSSIKIKSIKIGGIKNPLITIEGFKYDDNDCEFLVYADKEKMETTEYRIGKNNFVVRAVLPKKCKNVLVNLKENDSVTFIKSLKNYTLRRVMNKVYSVFYSFFHKLFLILQIVYFGVKKLWKDYHFLVPPKMWKKYWQSFKNRLKHNNALFAYDPYNPNDYNKWLEENEVIKTISDFKYNPLISILIPVYNIEPVYLKECVESILNQTYQNFEIILVDDCSTKKETVDVLKEYENTDERIIVKYRKKNGHISKATNDALKLAKGQFIGLVDNDDTLRVDALSLVVEALNKNPDLDMIYSDEDKIDLNGKRCEPNFKPDYSPDLLLSYNYICHFTVLRKKIVDEIKGFRVGTEGVQDYDLFLRFTEKTDKIYHIPEILYHWRMVLGSTSMMIDNKNYALERGKTVLEDALKRRNIKGTVKICEDCPYYIVDYNLEKEPKVTILIPIRDHADITLKCLKSIYEKTKYQNYEVVIINNNSVEKETFELLDEYKKKYDNFKVIDANFEFNYSKINNLGVEKTKSDYILLLNNDIEVITPRWLNIMVGYASQKHIGAVGAKLLYPDNTIQHAGVIIGLGGIAGHAYVGADRYMQAWGGRLSVPINYSAVTAACLLVSRQKFLEVKGLDEKLQVAFNDVDFNLKLREKGYYNVFLPQVELYHYESKSRGLDTEGEKYKRFLREGDYLMNKWKDKFYDPFYNKNYSLKYYYLLDRPSKEGVKIEKKSKKNN